LEAFTQLLAALPEHSGMAFVLVQHLEPNHDSLLTNILSKATRMRVIEVEDGMVVTADQIYVIPPNANMALMQGMLRLSPRVESHGAHLSIDYFLSSLAQDRGRHAIGVVLSGTGFDGTLGLAEIKAAGGITFAQDGESAKFPGMPLSAVAAGCVDIVLPPADIAGELSRIGMHPYLGNTAAEEPEQAFVDPAGDFPRIIHLLRGATGVDFTHYRDSTLKRRILRRMLLGKWNSLADYVRRLESDPGELKSLYQDILIHVTRFFRDPEAFRALESSVLPEIVKNKDPKDTLRVWVAGCATGEEAYSLAIAITEFQDGQQERHELRIFASDICETPALERSRAGVYPENIEQDVSPERLRRFFVKEAGGYRINKELREMILFAKHDITADPPFARIDLISCRNVLIYLSNPLQRRIIPAFHYALNPGGFLLLGNSETVGKDTDLFSPVNARLRIYIKKAAALRLPNLMAKGTAAVSPGKKAGPVRIPAVALDYQQAADRLVLRTFVPPGVLVNKDMDVLQFRGRTSPFLEPPQGGVGMNIAVMAQESLALEIRNAIGESLAKAAAVRKADVRILDGQQVLRVNLSVLPIQLPDAAESCFLVLFENADEPAFPPAAPAYRAAIGPAVEEEVAMLRIGLAASREYVQNIREQCEAVNEELKTANEEMESSNEELQSTNEELETAKEELQSANEELATMNEELRNRNGELVVVNDDLSNLLTSVQIPILMLGGDLRIRRFTPTAGKTLHLTGSDIGRPIGNIRFAMPDFDFERHVNEVIASQEPMASEALDQDGCWRSLRIHPYRSSDGSVDGVVMVLLDIDAIKRAQQRLQESGDYARAIVNTVREPLLILDGDLRIHSANKSFYRLFAAEPGNTEGRRLREMDGSGRWQTPEMLALLEIPPDSGGIFEDLEATLDLPAGPRALLLNARRLLLEDGRTKMTLLAMQDVTERRRAERDLRLHKFFSDQSPDPYYLADKSGRLTYVNRSACDRLGYTVPELLAFGLVDVEPACTTEVFAALFERARGSRAPAFETEHVAKDGSRFPVECSVTGVDFEGEALVLVVARDITERKRAEEALHQAEEKLRQAQRMEAIGKLAGGVAHDFNNLLTAINGYSALGLAQAAPESGLHGYMEEINKAGERAASLTRQLLAYSRKQILVSKVLDLNFTVANTHKMLARLVGDHIHLALSLDASLGMVKADAGQMEQVLVNLVVNARDAMPNGGEITLKTRNADLDGDESPESVLPTPPGGYVVLSVTDNGSGMDAEVQKRIFDPFYTTKGIGKGTGLGLSVVQGIVAQSGGFISVESKPGKGSEFSIYLPREAAVEITPAPTDRRPGSGPRGSETVLLVEDEVTVRNFTRKLLEMQGYRVLEAHNGESAILVNEQHKELEIHLLVTDMVMPGMGGKDVALKFLATRPESHVLFMSGYTEDSMFGPDGAPPGVALFLHKPFTPSEFAHAVREALDISATAPHPTLSYDEELRLFSSLRSIPTPLYEGIEFLLDNQMGNP
jgi:two-component system, chemotaxis family, CheB/CheR fusion protein